MTRRTTQKKLFLKPVSKSGTELIPNNDCHFELLEFEVNGYTINRIRKPIEEINQHIDNFYQRYGARGQAYLIRSSKMNFKSLIEQCHES